MLSGDNGILQRATDAKQTSERAEAKEQAQMDIMAWVTDKTANHESSSLDDSKVKTILTGKSYVKEAKDTSFITAKGEYEIPYSELYTASNLPSIPTLTAGTYTAGQEVELGGEKFFVLEDQGNTVKLLAKYCLNQAGTAQTDASATTSTYGRNFSKTAYWPDGVYLGDLQTNKMIEDAENDGDVEEGIPNAILAAQNYGDAMGISGRLMTYDEANTIANTGTDLMKKILFGNWTAEDDIDESPSDGFLNFWLGTSYSAHPGVMVVMSQYSVVHYDSATAPSFATFGVRPIVFVSES